MEVKEAMNQGVITVNPESKPLDAFKKMYKEGVRRLFVLDGNGDPKGVVSYSDLIGVLGSLRPTNNEMASLNISDIMSEDVMTIDSDNMIEDAANLMVRADVSGLLVLEKDKPVGVITRTDICRMVAAELLIPA
ncbi:MAG: CBS domain-containing protein [Methanobacterium sp. ERen5]|nr:MAG: CBS domain-containing protein [Methanobacterium sp. ERen5]